MVVQIKKIAKDIAIELHRYNDNLNIYLFGSSLVNNNAIVRDVDMLILENGTNIRLKFRKQLLNMKKEFLECGTPFSFSTYNRSLDSIFEKSIAKINKNSHIKISAKFTFGPLDKSIISTPNEIFFHIKGPIFIDEFILFCEAFPFHAKSIIHNNKRLVGKFDIYQLDKYIDIKRNDYIDWLNSLKMRADKSQSNYELKKLIKKIIITFLIYRRKYTINDTTINDVLHKFNIDINQNKDIFWLKGTFNKLFKYSLNSTGINNGNRAHTILE